MASACNTNLQLKVDHQKLIRSGPNRERSSRRSSSIIYRASILHLDIQHSDIQGRPSVGIPSTLDALHHTSRPAAAVREDLSQSTLGETLDKILPEYFEAGSHDNSNIGETASVSAVGSPPEESRQVQVKQM